MNANELHYDRASPQLLPLGECGLLVKFSNHLDDASNALAIGFAHWLQRNELPGVVEIVPSLVSVFLRYDPLRIGFSDFAGAVRLALSEADKAGDPVPRTVSVDVSFGGNNGPDLATAAALCELNETKFVGAHNSSKLRVLAGGFAPGFVYCGLHPKPLHVPRRAELHSSVPAGSILFAAGQTSITATDGPTGWHVIGRTDFRNFDPQRNPPTKLAAGDLINFRVAE